MAGEKILSYKVTSDPKDAIKNYDDFVKIVLAGAEKIQQSEKVSASNILKVGESVRRSADQVKDALNSIAKEAADQAKASADEQRRIANQLADEIEGSVQKRIDAEKRLAALQEEIAGRGSKGPTKKQSAQSDAIQQEIENLKILETRTGESAEIRANAEREYAAKVVKIDTELAAQQQQITEHTNQARSSSTLALVSVQRGLSNELGNLQSRVTELTGSNGLGTVAGQLGTMAAEAGPVGIAVGGVTAALIGGIAAGKAFVDMASDLNEQLHNDEQASGAAAESIITVQQALIGAGKDGADAVKILTHLSETFRKFQGGDQEAAGVLSRLVGGEEELKKIRTVDDLVFAIDGNFKNLGPSVQRTGDLVAAFGAKGERSVAAVLGTLKDVNEESKSLGLIFTPEQRAALEQYDAAMDHLAATIRGVKLQIGADLAPILASIAETAQSITKGGALLSSINPLTALGRFGSLVVEVTEGVSRLKKEASEHAQVTETEQKSVEGLTGALKELDRELDSHTKQARAGAGEEAQFVEEEVRARILSEKEAAEQILIINQGLNELLVAQARAKFEKLDQARFEALKNGFVSPEKYKEIADQALQAEVALQTALTGARQQGVNDRKAIEAAALAETLDNQRKLGTVLDTELTKRNQQIDAIEAVGIQTHEDAERAKLAATQNRITQQAILLGQELEDTSTTVERRKQIETELFQLSNDFTQSEINGSRALAEARIRDAKEVADVTGAYNDQQIAKNNVLFNLKKEQGASDFELARLQEENARLALNSLDAQISALRKKREIEIAQIEDAKLRQQAETKANLEVVPLETQRIELAERLRQAHLATMAAIVSSTNEAGKALLSFEDLQKNALKRIQDTKDSVVSAAGGIGGAIAAINKKGQEDLAAIAGATSETIGKILADAQDQFIRFQNYLGLAPQIAGILDLQFRKGFDALIAAQRKAAELAAEEQRKREEEARRASEERLRQAQSEAQSIASEREKIEEASSKKIADLRKQESDLEKDTAQKRVEIITDGNQKILDAEKRAAEVRVRQAQDEAARLLRIERDLQAAREDSQAQSIQTLEDQRQSSLEKQADLEGQLSEAKAKGDKTAQAKIEKELARLKEDQRLAEEQAAAEDRARQTAKNQQELDLELQRIAAIYGSRRDNLRAIRTLEDQGRTDLLNDLKASQTREENAINEHFNQKLTRLKTQLADEDTERQKAYAKERSEADQAVNDAKADLQKRLTDLQTYHTNRLNEIKNAIAAEKAEYTKAMDDLANKAAEFAKKFGTSIDAILDGFKKISDAANNTKLPGGGASSNTSTTGGTGGGSSAEVGPRNQPPPGTTTGGNQTGNQSGGLGTDPGTYTGNGSGTAPKDSRKDSATVLAQFLARVLTFKSEGHQPLKSDLAQLRIMRDGWVLPNQDPILPLITSADYNKGLAAFKQFWTLKNVYEEWRRRRITVSFAIHLIEELVEANLCTASDAAAYTAYMKTQIDDFGKEKFSKRPAFESVPSVASTPPPAGLKQAPGPTPIPGQVGGNGSASPFDSPTTIPGPPKKTSPYQSGGTGGTIQGSTTGPVFNEGPGIARIQQLFRDVIEGRQTFSYAASALAAWENATPRIITKATYGKALTALENYHASQRTPADAAALLAVFGGGVVTGGEVFQSALLNIPANLTTGGTPSAPLLVQPQQPFNFGGGGGVGTRVKRPGALQIGPDQRNVTFINQIDYVDRAKLRADADKNLVTLLDQLGG